MTEQSNVISLCSELRVTTQDDNGGPLIQFVWKLQLIGLKMGQWPLKGGRGDEKNPCGHQEIM